MKPDGGAAFGHGAENGHCCGATLRDFFAAAALQGILSNDSVHYQIQNDYILDDAAKRAYEFADSMLKAREAA